jgi:hypothetical protein
MMASDLLQSLEIKIFLSQNYIAKVGQVFTEGIFLLEG